MNNTQRSFYKAPRRRGEPQPEATQRAGKHAERGGAVAWGVVTATHGPPAGGVFRIRLEPLLLPW
jgi:ribosomal protein L35AE/L33A